MLILHMYVYVVVRVTSIFFTSNNYFFAFGTFKIFSTSYLEIHRTGYGDTGLQSQHQEHTGQGGKKEGGREGERDDSPYSLTEHSKVPRQRHSIH